VPRSVFRRGVGIVLLKKTLLWLLAFAAPLVAYLGRVALESLNSYDGRCMGLLDVQGPICTKVEYVYDYFFNGFVGGFTLLIIVGWGFVIFITSILASIIKTRCARSRKEQ